MFKTIISKLIMLAVLPGTPLSGNDNKFMNASNLGKAQKYIVQWYQGWGSYLHLHSELMNTILGTIANATVKGIYNLNRSVESIWNSMFNLLGWDGALSKPGSPLHGLYSLISIIGWALLTIGILVVVWQSFGHEVKWSKIFPNVIMVALTITVLPLIMQTAGSVASPATGSKAGLGDIAVTAKNEVSKVNVSKTSSVSGIAIEPLRDNIVDLARVAKGDWQYDPKRLDISKTNNITSSRAVNALDLGESMDAETEKNYGLTDKSTKSGFSNLAEPLEYKFDDNSVEGNSQGNQAINGYLLLKRKTGLGMGTLNDEAYARYSVNWLALFLQSITLWVILIVASFKVAKDIFELTGMNLIAPLLAYQSVKSDKKLRDLVSSITGLYFSLVLMNVVMKLFFAFINIAPTKLPSSLTGVAHGIAVWIIYLAGGFALFSGVTYFEKVTGVASGFTDETSHAGAAAMMGAGAGSLAMAGAGAAGAGMSNLVNKVTGGGNRKNNTASGTTNAKGIPMIEGGSGSGGGSGQGNQATGLSGDDNTPNPSPSNTMDQNYQNDSDNPQSGQGLNDQGQVQGNSDGNSETPDDGSTPNGTHAGNQTNVPGYGNGLNDRNGNANGNNGGIGSGVGANAGTGGVEENDVEVPYAAGGEGGLNMSGESGAGVGGFDGSDSDVSGVHGLQDANGGYNDLPDTPPSQGTSLDDLVSKHGSQAHGLNNHTDQGHSNLNESANNGLIHQEQVNGMSSLYRDNPKAKPATKTRRPNPSVPNKPRRTVNSNNKTPETRGHKISRKVRSAGTTGVKSAHRYETMHNYGMSQRGNVNGVDSDDLD